MSRLGITVCTVVLALTGALLAPAAAQDPATGPARAAATAVEVEAPVPDLAWGPCQDLGAPDDRVLECATATVPLDYDDPMGATIDLDLARVPAADPGS